MRLIHYSVRDGGYGFKLYIYAFKHVPIDGCQPHNVAYMVILSWNVLWGRDEMSDRAGKRRWSTGRIHVQRTSKSNRRANNRHSAILCKALGGIVKTICNRIPHSLLLVMCPMCLYRVSCVKMWFKHSRLNIGVTTGQLWPPQSEV